MGMLSIAHSDLHRNRKTVPMLWRESAIVDYNKLNTKQAVFFAFVNQHGVDSGKE